MSSFKTPGVYVVEKNAFPNSVVEVATAVPAFVGYTEFAKNGDRSLLHTPWRISSMAEYEQYFGKASKPLFEIVSADAVEEGSGQTLLHVGSKTYKLVRQDFYGLYYAMRLFFSNGGGDCYIVSVDEGYTNSLEKDTLISGIDLLLKEQEPTLLLVPEAVYLKTSQDCHAVQAAMLQHCGGDMKNRFAILDIFGGHKSSNDASGNVVNEFRENIGTSYLDYGAAYYPWLHTTILSAADVDFSIISNQDVLIEALTDSAANNEGLLVLIEKIKTPDEAFTKEVVHTVLLKQSIAYQELMKELLFLLNMLAPGAAMAGIYTLVDHSREVWKAPANIGFSNVDRPCAVLTYADQEDLNVPPDGKAVNAIRYFTGEGLKVWGARTLDGNSLDWRYINVKRTMIMLEESIKNAVKAFVFEPNTATIWVTVRGMITNFLTGIWKRGGLAGATPDIAFSVHIGLGETMTPEDILEGLLNITVKVAVVRPDEFIVITFQQQMQKS